MSARRFKPYPAYKDSGVEWLGEIPAHWTAKRVRQACSRVTDGAHISPDTSSADVPFVSTVDIRAGAIDFDACLRTSDASYGYMERTGCRPKDGDVLFSKDGTVGTTAVVTTDRAFAVASSLVILSPDKNEVDARWLNHWLNGVFIKEQVELLLSGAALRRISVAKVGRLPVLLPPKLDEQRAIAAFLDLETARIDALVAKKERLIELLQEQRTALIEAAVATARAAPQTRLGYYVDLLPGYAFPSNEFSHDPDDVRLLRGVNISPEGIRWDETVLWPLSESARHAIFQLKEGDLVFGMDRPWISTGIRVAEVTKADIPSLLLQRVARLRARQGLSQGFLKLVLKSPQFRAYFEPILTGISVPHVSPEQILSFRLRLPTLEDQEVVCQNVKVRLLHIGSMCDVLRESINRLMELRTALISAVVTGKIDVRGASAQASAAQGGAA